MIESCVHDWVVEDMFAERDMRAFYHVRCVKCGAFRSGNADDIPTARFK